VSEGTICFEWVPTEWPPSRPTLLHTHRTDDGEVNLSCLPGGYLSVAVKSLDGERGYDFQRVHLAVGGLVRFAFGWDSTSATMAASGQLLGPYSEHGLPLDLQPHSVHSPKGKTLAIDVAVLASATPEERLFLMTLDDLSSRLSRGTEYDCIRASGLLRQLLFDDPTPLVHAANRGIRVRLEFEIAVPRPPHEGIDKPTTSWHSLLANNGDVVEVMGLDRFLRQTTISHEGVDCNVRDVIAAVAHVFGGIHLGHAGDGESAALVTLRDRVLVQEQPIVLRSLQDIARVTTNALMPLVEAIAVARGHKPREA